MIDVDYKVEFDIDLDFCLKLLESYSDRDLELIVTDNSDIREINRVSRGVDRATDVLSFPLEEFPNAPLGSIVISIDMVKLKAKEFGHSDEDEFKLLFIHGLLHLLGFDHEVDSNQMREEERKIIESYNLPKSLIIRSQKL